MFNRVKMKSMIYKTGMRNKTLIKHMDFANCRQTFLLISFILTCATPDVTVEQEQIIASLGSSVTLKCIVTSDDIPTLSWFYNDNRILANQKVVEEDKIVVKYTLSSTNLNSTRTYNLQIRNVLPTDDGMYTCLVTIAEYRIKRHIKLAVKYLSENPSVSCQFLYTSDISIQHGSGHQTKKTKYQTQLRPMPITGISFGANIGKNIFVNITIMKSAHHKPDLIPVKFAIIEQSDVVDGVNITYPVNVTGLDGWKFWCVVRQSMILQQLNSSTPMLIKPRVNITKLNIDSDEQFKCEVESYPDATFRWIICEKEIANVQAEECKVLNSTSSYVTLVDIGAVDDELILICEAQNAVGTGHGNRTIFGYTGPADMAITHTEPTGTTICRHTESTNKIIGGSHLVLWSIAGGFVLLFGLALTIISLYFGKESRYIKRYLLHEKPVTSKNVKKSDAHQNVKAGNAGFGIISYDSSSRQIAAEELASLCATPVKTKTECTSYDEYRSESGYDLRGPSESEDDSCGHTSRLMAETQALYHTLEDPNDDNNTTKASLIFGDHGRSVLVAALGNANSTTTTTTQWT